MVFDQLENVFDIFSNRCSPMDVDDAKPFNLYLAEPSHDLPKLCRSLVCYAINKDGEIKRLEDTDDSEMFFEIAANPSCNLTIIKRSADQTVDGVRDDLKKRGIRRIEEEIQLLMATLSNAGCIDIHKTVKTPMSTSIADNPLHRRIGITAYTEICLIGVTDIPTIEIIT